MTSEYQRTIDFLYSQTPQFQQIGAAAYKPGLDTVIRLAEKFGNPHAGLKMIHVGGTNGKGSTAHSIAAVLQSAGYKTGLFTSPHLIDFRERIKINGEMITREGVTDFVDRFRHIAAENGLSGAVIEPSFFELTTVMALDWFAQNEVDYAVIEVGLGGRLDSTNIITPILSIITNISFDHVAQLGNTLVSIASEKAGIIKSGVPCVVGEADGEVKEVFKKKAETENSNIIFADCELPARDIRHNDEYLTATTPFGRISYGLTGFCQERNLQTIISALNVLRNLGLKFPDEVIAEGLRGVATVTGLSGRWMKIADNPTVVCDTGHNEGGWRYISRQLESHRGPLFMVLGFVNDKDVSHILPLIPKRASIVYTRASVPRALHEADLAEIGRKADRPGVTAPNVAAALETARSLALACTELCNVGETPLVFVGGSTFVVADLLATVN